MLAVLLAAGITNCLPAKLSAARMLLVGKHTRLRSQTKVHSVPCPRQGYISCFPLPTFSEIFLLSSCSGFAPLYIINSETYNMDAPA